MRLPSPGVIILLSHEKYKKASPTMPRSLAFFAICAALHACASAFATTSVAADDDAVPAVPLHDPVLEEFLDASSTNNKLAPTARGGGGRCRAVERFIGTGKAKNETVEAACKEVDSSMEADSSACNARPGCTWLTPITLFKHHRNRKSRRRKQLLVQIADPAVCFKTTTRIDKLSVNAGFLRGILEKTEHFLRTDTKAAHDLILYHRPRVLSHGGWDYGLVWETDSDADGAIGNGLSRREIREIEEDEKELNKDEKELNFLRNNTTDTSATSSITRQLFHFELDMANSLGSARLQVLRHYAGGPMDPSRSEFSGLPAVGTVQKGGENAVIAEKKKNWHIVAEAPFPLVSGTRARGGGAVAGVGGDDSHDGKIQTVLLQGGSYAAKGDCLGVSLDAWVKFKERGGVTTLLPRERTSRQTNSNDAATIALTRRLLFDFSTDVHSSSAVGRGVHLEKGEVLFGTTLADNKNSTDGAKTGGGETASSGPSSLEGAEAAHLFILDAADRSAVLALVDAKKEGEAQAVLKDHFERTGQPRSQMTLCPQAGFEEVLK